MVYENEKGTSSTDSDARAMASVGILSSHIRAGKAEGETQLPRFHVFDGALRIVIEAQAKKTLDAYAAKWAGKLFARVKTNE